MKTISLNRVVHVGTMDISRKRPDSLEGNGLSISLCPSAWERITRQTEGRWNMLEKKDSKFLLATSLTQKEKEQIADWGIENGYVEKAKTFVISWYDDEMEDTVMAEYATKEEAEEELEDGQDLEEKANGLLATPKMNATIGYKVAPILVFDLLTTLYAEEKGYDGVYWDEVLDISALSAPRGVIANSRLSDWEIIRDKKLINERFNELYCSEAMGW